MSGWIAIGDMVQVRVDHFLAPTEWRGAQVVQVCGDSFAVRFLRSEDGMWLHRWDSGRVWK